MPLFLPLYTEMLSIVPGAVGKKVGSACRTSLSSLWNWNFVPCQSILCSTGKGLSHLLGSLASFWMGRIWVRQKFSTMSSFLFSPWAKHVLFTCLAHDVHEIMYTLWKVWSGPVGKPFSQASKYCRWCMDGVSVTACSCQTKRRSNSCGSGQSLTSVLLSQPHQMVLSTYESVMFSILSNQLVENFTQS